MAEDPNPNSSSATTKTEQGGKKLKASWKTLFNFTTRKHAATLVPGVGCALGASLAIPVLTFVLGAQFEVLAAYTSGRLPPSEFRENVETLCLALTIVGGLSWLLNSAYSTLFMVFGEQQAANARHVLFFELMKRDFEWFQAQKDGTGAFLSAVQR